MEQKNLIKKTFLAGIVGLILPLAGEAQDICGNCGAAHSYRNQYYIYPDGSHYEPLTYTTIDYHYNQPYYYGHMQGGYRDAHSFLHFGRRLDNSHNFSSGISSYQGTSTGPGPNGGYPGAPRGIYPTHYIDDTIYPYTQVQFPPRNHK